jgi:hypothetical protein
MDTMACQHTFRQAAGVGVWCLAGAGGAVWGGVGRSVVVWGRARGLSLSLCASVCVCALVCVRVRASLRASDELIFFRQQISTFRH